MQVPGINLPSIPPPSGKRIALRVTSAAERILRQGHPWLFENAIVKQSHEGQPGDLAVIFDKQRKFIAIGLYDPTSIIRVRVLQHRKPATIDRYWFVEKIKAASNRRTGLTADTNAYRLIHGENDRLPGLVIDRYNKSLVMKIYTPAWIPYLSKLIPILHEIFNPKRIVLRLGRGVQEYPQFLYHLEDGVIIDGTSSDGPVLFKENGIWFEADLIHGQKTGFFLDQRDNRARVEKLSKGKNVLNAFSYTGGFSVYAARGRAEKVVSVDLSRQAVEVAKRNFLHNQDNGSITACCHEVLTGDVFKILPYLAQEKQSFELIVIDPPAFAKRANEIKKAISAYQQLTRLAIAVLSPGGILVQASCSSRVKPGNFFKAIHQAARQTGRPLKEFERTSHALDHPIGFPEGEYLKCLFAVA